VLRDFDTASPTQSKDFGNPTSGIFDIFLVSRINRCKQLDIISQYLPYDVSTRLAYDFPITIHLVYVKLGMIFYDIH